MKKQTKIILAVLLCTAVVLLTAAGLYAGNYYRATEVGAYMKSDETVAVKQIRDGYCFDGPGEKNALVFYPGAKVEETAYAPLMYTLASHGIDCFLIKMPLKLAFFGMNRADRVLAEYDYENYYLAGHSLGGAMAADYAEKHPEEYEGLFLLAAYPSKDLSATRLPVVFIYGENDRVLNREKLEEGFSLVPPGYEEVVIAGGNHAAFACYGAQKGDGEAAITASEQQEITANAILDRVKK